MLFFAISKNVGSHWFKLLRSQRPLQMACFFSSAKWLTPYQDRSCAFPESPVSLKLLGVMLMWLFCRWPEGEEGRKMLVAAKTEDVCEAGGVRGLWYNLFVLEFRAQVTYWSIVFFCWTPAWSPWDAVSSAGPQGLEHSCSQQNTGSVCCPEAQKKLVSWGFSRNVFLWAITGEAGVKQTKEGKRRHKNIMGRLAVGRRGSDWGKSPSWNEFFWKWRDTY